MQHKFSRTEILIGTQGLERLKQSHVMVFGVGGVGSFAVEALARAGVGRLTLVDYDEISLTNLNRQIHALYSTLGQAKVDVMKDRIAQINPEAHVDARKEFYREEKADDFLGSQPDYVVDAIDTVSGKVSLIKECRKRDIPLISSMGAGNRLSANNYKITDLSKTSGDPLAKAVRKLLRKDGITSGVKVVYSPDLPQEPLFSEIDDDSASKRQIPGSISFVPSVVGLLIAGEVVRDLLK
ncbi:tRNA threonylcarbamoyladenosine dehydratase [Desulfitobacterium sp.]|uniref:tRNA threonylcarbamoyladenosine dehydratase n=1 Tax=Desulfitobacterium sp. TaxID=49981 RepID=UPI002B1F5073|nr:tRNA threonylcarbamoyladenosine dehydratase [Desulfitobacterium sp.]MEA4901809.1 tRNA threonylcarbamoyladenosine dehydratase [Desulfitobacterium sp.]